MGRTMSNLRYFQAIFSPSAIKWWSVLYVLIILFYGSYVIWQVAYGSILETPEDSSTLVKIGLLEAIAFLVAWSFLLITITSKVVSKGKDLEFTAEKTTAAFQQHLEDHPDIQSDVERMMARVSESDAMLIQLKEESEQVAEENEQLRRQLAAGATKELGND